MSTYLNGQKAFESIVYARLIAHDGSRSYIEVPRVTTTQRDALQVRPGAIVYNTDAATLQVRTATGWEEVGLGSQPLAVTAVHVCASEAEQLALVVTEGAVCIRTDLSTTYIALNDQNATMGDWAELSAPTSGVISVNSKTGAVELVPGDIGAAEVGHAHVVGDVAGLQAALNEIVSGSPFLETWTITEDPANEDLVFSYVGGA